MPPLRSLTLHSIFAAGALALGGCAAIDPGGDDVDETGDEDVGQSADELKGACTTPQQTRTVVDSRCSTRSTYRCNPRKQWIFVGCAQPSSAGGGCWYQGRVVRPGFSYTVDHSLTCDSSALLTCVGGGRWREDYCARPAR